MMENIFRESRPLMKMSEMLNSAELLKSGWNISR